MADRAARKPSRRSCTCFAVESLDEAIALNNGVAQGLSSAHLHRPTCGSRALPLGARARDCGIANVNIGTRAPRSAAPSAARRRPAAGARPAPTPGRPTCAARPAPSTRRDLPLAQGVRFEIDDRQVTTTETRPDIGSGTEQKTAILPPWSVILHNDDHNDMIHVVRSLIKSVPNLGTSRADPDHARGPQPG